MTLFIVILPLLTFLFFSSKLLRLIDTFPIMMSYFCRRITPHQYLPNLTTTATSAAAVAPPPPHPPPPTAADETLNQYIPNSFTDGLLGIVPNTPNDVIHHHPFLLESSPMMTPNSPLPPYFPPKMGSGAFGFLNDVGGGVDGFVSCTESLGFESSGEIMRVDDQIDGRDHYEEESEEASVSLPSGNKRSKRWRMTTVDKIQKKFPPPISSLNQKGQPSYYLRPVRKDGRLELTEVKIHRPEILRAHREDGRLRLHLISHDQPEYCIPEEQEEEIEEEVIDNDEEINNVKLLNEDKEIVELESSVGSGGDQWKMGMAGGRCQDVAANHHHHHNVWSQQQHCVV